MAYIFGSIWDRRNRNALNELSKSIEYQGKTIQDLVAKGQLTPAQYAELIQKINGLISSGEITLDDMSPEVLSKIMESNPEFNLLSIPRDNSVTPKKTNFAKRSRNLFDGEFLRFAMNWNTEGNIQYRDATVDGKTLGVIVSIEPNKTYTITVYDKDLSDRFIAGITNEYPIFGVGGYKEVDTNVVRNDSLTTHTFTNTTNGRYLMLYTSSNGGKPRIQIEEGGESTSYEAPYILDTSVLDMNLSVGLNDLDFLVTSDINLFDGNYKRGALQVLNEQPMYRTGTQSEILAVVSVDPNETYTVKIHEPDKSNRFLVQGTTEYPNLMEGSWRNTEHSFIENNNTDEHTLKTPPNVNYLLIYVSNQGEQPLMQVEKGSRATSYKPKRYIPKELLESNNSASGGSSDNQTGSSYKLYATPPTDYVRPSTLESPASFVTDLKKEDIYGFYDDLMEIYPGNSQKKLLGYASSASGTQDNSTPIYEYTFSPQISDLDFNTMNSRDVLPTILIQSGLHGNEKLAVWTTYEVLKDIVSGSSDFAKFYRQNINIKIIPLVNPGGFDLNTRNNPNNVNINRNFEPNWTSTQQHPGTQPLSELESKVLNNWFSENSNALALIDVHNISGIHNTSQGRYGFVWIIARDETLKMTSLNMLNKLSEDWLKEIESFANFPSNTILGEVSDYQSGMSIEQAYDVHGIKSVVSDPERAANNYYPNMKQNGLELLKINVDTLGGLMVGIAKNLIH